MLVQFRTSSCRTTSGSSVLPAYVFSMEKKMDHKCGFWEAITLWGKAAKGKHLACGPASHSTHSSKLALKYDDSLLSTLVNRLMIWPTGFVSKNWRGRCRTLSNICSCNAREAQRDPLVSTYAPQHTKKPSANNRKTRSKLFEQFTFVVSPFKISSFSTALHHRKQKQCYHHMAPNIPNLVWFLEVTPAKYLAERG